MLLSRYITRRTQLYAVIGSGTDGTGHLSYLVSASLAPTVGGLAYVTMTEHNHRHKSGQA